MKCLVFSDSHNETYLIKKAISSHPDAEVIFFLGDGLSDIEEIYLSFPERKILAVKGNCDFRSFVMNEFIEKTAVIDLLGKKIVYTHGDLYGVKYGMAGLERLAKETFADVILFGHTHTPVLEYFSSNDIKPFYVFNPGSIGSREGSFGIMDLYEGKEPLFSHGNFL